MHDKKLFLEVLVTGIYLKKCTMNRLCVCVLGSWDAIRAIFRLVQALSELHQLQGSSALLRREDRAGG